MASLNLAHINDDLAIRALEFGATLLRLEAEDKVRYLDADRRDLAIAASALEDIAVNIPFVTRLVRTDSGAVFVDGGVDLT